MEGAQASEWWEWEARGCCGADLIKGNDERGIGGGVEGGGKGICRFDARSVGKRVEVLPSCSSWYEPGFSASARAPYGTRQFCAVGTSPASTHQELVVWPCHPVVTTCLLQTVPDVPWGQNGPWWS